VSDIVPWWLVKNTYWPWACRPSRRSGSLRIREPYKPPYGERWNPASRVLSYSALEGHCLVDNGATLFWRRVLMDSFFPGMQSDHFQRTLDFAGGEWILGIKRHPGGIRFLSEQRTELENGVIEKLLKAFDSPKVGAVSPVIRYSAKTLKNSRFAGYHVKYIR